MTRLIDADALRKAFENLASDDYSEPIWYQQTVFETIDDAPTVEERPQDEWIRIDDEKVKCPICEVIHLMYSYPRTTANFCPNCGADMRGDKEWQKRKK